MRVGVVDIGTNSTRLLIADVRAGMVDECVRRSVVTRLGEGVDSLKTLSAAAQERVFEVVAEYASELERAGCEGATALMTSAVRDAVNGVEFAAEISERYQLESRILTGEEEALLTFAGVTTGLPERNGHLLAIDIGGGSLELVTGIGDEVEFFASLDIGVIRHGERFLTSDPSSENEHERLARSVREQLEKEIPKVARESVDQAIAVAGTPTSAAAIDLDLDPYDSARVEGHGLSLQTLRSQLNDLAGMPLETRKNVVGLHPDRATVIVPGLIILIEVLKAFSLSEVRVSEHDILWGAALRFGHTPAPTSMD